MRVTMMDIARACGVSRPTVTLILNGQGQAYSADTREKVLQAAKKLGYRRNNSARAIQSGRFNAVALLLSRSSELGGVASGFLTRVESVASEAGSHLTIAHLPDASSRDTQTAPKVFTESLVDGLIVHGNHDLPKELRSQILAIPGCPAVWVGDSHPTNAVWADEAKATRDAVEYLRSLGHRRIAYVGPLEWTRFDAVQRKKTFTSAMRDAGLTPVQADFVKPFPGSIQGIIDNANTRLRDAIEWLSRPNRPTAVLAYNGDEATLILFAAIRLGLHVPRDLSIMTFSDWIVNANSLPTSGMMVKTSMIGERAIRMLFRRIEDPRPNQPSEVVHYDLIQGHTTAAPPTEGASTGSSSRKTSSARSN
jgi:DNA-binding LacI/PurR family transcriptional regulator